MSAQHPLRGRAPGNREVSRNFIVGTRGDLSGARAEAFPERREHTRETWFPSWERSDERGVFA